jgi:hypothetical protein
MGWDAVAAQLNDPPGMAGPVEDLQHLRAIATSVLRQGRAHDLAVSSGAVCDLIVTPTPVGEPPHDVVVVRAPNGVRPPRHGQVRIEHHPLVGRQDSIARPVAEAVGLFWRFMIEKYGIAPLE